MCSRGGLVGLSLIMFMCFLSSHQKSRKISDLRSITQPARSTSSCSSSLCSCSAGATPALAPAPVDTSLQGEAPPASRERRLQPQLLLPWKPPGHFTSSCSYCGKNASIQGSGGELAPSSSLVCGREELHTRPCLGQDEQNSFEGTLHSHCLHKVNKPNLFVFFRRQ